MYERACASACGRASRRASRVASRRESEIMREGMKMVWEGMNVVAAGRKMLGATRPQDSEPALLPPPARLLISLEFGTDKAIYRVKTVST